MRAVLLAAGLGTRLRPLTDHTPKCLVEVGGRPLLDIWLEALGDVGVDDVLVNVHHLADQVQAHVARRAGGPRVHLVHEPELLGSAGTLVANRAFLGHDTFLAINADNLTDFDLHELVKVHRDAGRPATLATFRTPRPSLCGIVEVQDGLMVGFEEKPAHPRSDLANAGLYVFEPEAIDLIDAATPADIGFHLLPHLVGRAGVVDIGRAYFMDIGTPEALERASRDWTGGGAR